MADVLYQHAHLQTATHRAAGETTPVRVALAAAALGFVIVGSLVPFRFNRAPAGAELWYGLRLIGLPASPLHDIVTNIAVYVPVGASVFLVLRRLLRSPIRAGVCACSLGLIVSVAMEWLQTMMSARVASWTDVAMNGLGTATGVCVTAMAIPLWARATQALAAHPISTAAKLLAAGLLIYHLIPFDVVTNATQLRASLAQTRVWPFWGRWSGGSYEELVGWAGLAGQFAVLGFLGVWSAVEDGRDRRAAAIRSAATVMIVALVIEVCQVFVVSHAFDSVDWLAGVGGGLIGIGVAVATGGRRFVALRGALCVFLVVQVVYLALSNAVPFDLSFEHVQWERLLRWPLLAQLNRPCGAALADLSTSVVSFALLAGLVGLLVGTDRPRRRMVFIVSTVVGVAGLCQFLQLLSATRFPDVGDVLLAVCAALPIALWPTNPPTTDSRRAFVGG